MSDGLAASTIPPEGFNTDCVEWSGPTIVFRRPDRAYGALSNFATRFPLTVAGHRFTSSEALYQAMRFPASHRIQQRILEAGSPREAKRISHEHGGDEAWWSLRTPAMWHTLLIKYQQHRMVIGPLLAGSGTMPIVELSPSDEFWGATRRDPHSLFGANLLGQMWMEIRRIDARDQLRPQGLNPDVQD